MPGKVKWKQAAVNKDPAGAITVWQRVSLDRFQAFS